MGYTMCTSLILSEVTLSVKIYMIYTGWTDCLTRAIGNVSSRDRPHCRDRPHRVHDMYLHTRMDVKNPKVLRLSWYLKSIMKIHSWSYSTTRASVDTGYRVQYEGHHHCGRKLILIKHSEESNASACLDCSPTGCRSWTLSRLRAWALLKGLVHYRLFRKSNKNIVSINAC